MCARVCVCIYINRYIFPGLSIYAMVIRGKQSRPISWSEPSGVEVKVTGRGTRGCTKKAVPSRLFFLLRREGEGGEAHHAGPPSSPASRRQFERGTEEKGRKKSTKGYRQVARPTGCRVPDFRESRSLTGFCSACASASLVTVLRTHAHINARVCTFMRGSWRESRLKGGRTSQMWGVDGSAADGTQLGGDA